jgi:hypothetical protein
MMHVVFCDGGHLTFVRTDVSEDYNASIIRLQKIKELGKLMV